MAEETLDYLVAVQGVTTRFLSRGVTPRHQMIEALCMVVARTVAGAPDTFDEEIYNDALDKLIDAGFMRDDGFSKLAITSSTLSAANDRE